jgi:catechol 2,3-dioxygenase-like lactoylglutathione lyase family enzyme
MTIVLDHTIVPVRDSEASARFFARIFDLLYEGTVSRFATVRVNDTFVLDFDTRATLEPHHYAFNVSAPEFEAIFQRIKDEGIRYGSNPRSQDDMAIDSRGGRLRFYFKDPDGHLLEVLRNP